MGLRPLEFRFIYILNPGWLQLPLTGTNFHGSSLFEPLKFYCIYSLLPRSGSFLVLVEMVCDITILHQIQNKNSAEGYVAPGKDHVSMTCKVDNCNSYS